MNKNRAMIAAALLLLPACTWLTPSEEGLKVRVAYLSQVEQCKQLGRATVSVIDSFLTFSRSEEKVSEELEVLGRDAAAEMGGDTIVAMSKVVDGEQVFNVYKCK